MLPNSLIQLKMIILMKLGSFFQEFIKLLFHNNRCVQSACLHAISDHIHPHGIKYFGAKTFQITAPVTQLRLAGRHISESQAHHRRTAQRRELIQIKMASASSTIVPFSSNSSLSRLHRTRSPASLVAFRRRQLRVSASFASTMERPAIAPISSSGSLYEVLGIQTGATCQEIKTAYRRLARVLHPDVAPASSDSFGREFMRVHDAYATLSDPQKRADYDRTLHPRRRRVGPSFAASMSAAPRGSTVNSGFQGYTRRHWETDQCW
ncbi:hypothetical protein SAY86_003909 [Trapa natans]|uniref:J domain-containing protein n=1 Tax=Trapa natans TaxID=22666 RepID=A0AAN7RHG7_TRANT|nr:hypothetical protein SAY86_003909 [Trapa natans]